jgi:hypothetical protein
VKLPTVDGREYIPLRLIRFVTAGQFSADILLGHLCHEGGDEYRPLYACDLDGVKIQPEAWCDISRIVEGMNDKPELRDDEWIEQSNTELPAGVFVWRDEFEEYSSNWYGPEHVFVTNPVIPCKLAQSIWEGFDVIRIKTPTESLAVTGRSEKKSIVQILAERAVASLLKADAKYPAYTSVIKELNRLSKSDDEVGAIIEKADLTGIYTCSRDKPIAIQTLKNWMCNYKKSVPGIF